MLTNMRIRMAQIRMVLWDWRNGRSGGWWTFVSLAWGLCHALQSPFLSKLPTCSGGVWLTKIRFSERGPQMLGPHDRGIAPADQHARGGTRRARHLCVDVEIGQLARTAL